MDNSFITRTKKTLVESRLWLRTAAILFAASLVITAAVAVSSPKRLDAVFGPLLERLGDLSKEVFRERSTTHGILILFLNNWRAATFAIFLGVILGLFPILVLTINGGLIGLVAALASHAGQLKPLVFGVVPHGLFEIPAIIIASAFGMKLGLGWVGAKNGRGSYFRATLKQVITVVWPLVTLLLIAAAVIEVVITPLLLRLTTG